METEKQFTEEYVVVRRLLLSGRTDLGTAKMWLAKHGELTAERLSAQADSRLKRRAALNADRELKKIQSYEKKAYDLDEDKDE